MTWLNADNLWWYVDGDDDDIKYVQKIFRKFSGPIPSRFKSFLSLGEAGKMTD
jgi:hypothetical protein